MNTYKAFYHGKTLEVQAETSLKARDKAAEQFKAKNKWEVNVVVIAINSKEVVHIADF